MAITGLPTNQGVSILSSNLRENVKRFALFGTNSPTADVPFSEASTLSSLNAYLVGKFQVSQAYFDDNGVLTFECPIPYDFNSTKWVSVAGLIWVDPDTGSEVLVAVASTPKFQKTAGIGGNIIFKVPVAGTPATPIFKDQPYITDAQFGAFVNERDGGLLAALSQSGLALREIEKTRHIRFQSGKITIYNRGVIEGLSATKSTTATRNVSFSAGKIFVNRIIPVPELVNTANVPSNNDTVEHTCYLYAYLNAQGEVDIACTLLDESPPEDAIPLYEVLVPAGNTESNDPYLANVTLIDIRRLEPNFPVMLITSPTAYVELPYNVLDSDYEVDLEVESFRGSGFQLGYVYAGSKAANGFSVYYNGTADQIVVRWTVRKLSL